MATPLWCLHARTPPTLFLFSSPPLLPLYPSITADHERLNTLK